jgi:hypothetical protein
MNARYALPRQRDSQRCAYEKMKRKRYAFSALLCITALFAYWSVTNHYRQLERVAILRACDDFAALLNVGDIDSAYASLTESARRTWTPEQFAEAELCSNPTCMGAPVRKLNVNPLMRSATVIFASAELNLPMWMEDGVSAARIDLTKRDGVWRVDDRPMGIGS